MSTHRLAAILFADIVGYTAMMQQDEAKGIARASQLRRAIEELLPQHGGILIEMRGDGAFCLFDSSTEAVHCALKIQQAVSAEVPLRIGLHLGDITQKDGHIFGDAVNIASRVESMGVAGAVLVSSSIRQQIKNKPEFELASLGKFGFKNVAEPMTVFALTNEGLSVPKPEEMRGKGKKLSTGQKTGPKSWLRMASIGFVAMTAGAILFWAVGTKSVGKAQLLSEKIREEKVAVAIFENFTGDEQLDVLGYLASEWISSSLREIGIKTVPPEMIRQYKEYIGVFPNNPDGKASFAEITEAQYLISGSYFPHGDSLQLLTRLLDTQTGDEVQQFPTLYAKKSDKEDLVERIRQRLMGYWAIEKNRQFPKVKPPNYKAYETYLTCSGADLKCNLNVLELDSTFLLNHTHLMFAAVWWNNDSIFYASKAYVRRHWEECTAYEKNFYTFANEFWEGNYEKAFQAVDNNYQNEPRDVLMMQEAASFASVHLKRPEIAIPRYKKFFADYELIRDKLVGNNFHIYLDALNRLGRHEQVIQFVGSIPKRDWLEKANAGAWFELYIAYLESNQLEEAIQYIDEMFEEKKYTSLFARAAYIWSTTFQDTIENPFHLKIQQHAHAFPAMAEATEWIKCNAMNGEFYGVRLKEYQPYLLGNWDLAEQAFLQLKQIDRPLIQPKDPLLRNVTIGQFDIWIETMLGCIYARQGKREQARKKLEMIEAMRQGFPERHSPGTRGFISYQQAKIHALLGDKEATVSLLKRSIHEGRVMFWWAFTMDYDLASLRGYEPYERLVKGPE